MSPPNAPAAELHPAIRRALARFRWRWLVLRGLRTLGSIAAVAGWIFSLALVLDRYLLLEDSTRILVTTIAMTSIGGLALWRTARLFRSLGALSIARAIERVCGDLDESLISSIELTRRRGRRQRISLDLLGALQDSTSEQLRRLRPEAHLPARPAVVALAHGASVWLLLGGLFVLYPLSLGQLAQRFLHPSSPLPRPSTVELQIEPGSTVLATGTEVSIVAELRRGDVATGLLAWRFAGDPETREATLPFRRGDQAVTLTRTFPPLEAALEYRLTAGDFQSRWYRIDVRDPPRPRRFSLTFRYPAYTRLPDLTRTSGSGAIRTLEGTSVSIELEASEPLARATVRVIEGSDPAGRAQGPGPLLPLKIDGRVARLENLGAARTLTAYELRLEGRDGVHNDGQARYPVEVTPDRAPTVDLVSPRSAEISVEPTSVVELAYRAADDVGLAGVALIFHPGTEDESRIALDSAAPPSSLDSPGAAVVTRTEPATQTIETTYRLDVAALAVEAGASVPFVLEATDLAGHAVRTGPRQLRAVFNPLYPEGPDWPARLADLETRLRSALEDWKQLGPISSSIETPPSLDAAAIESLNAKAASTIDLLTRVRRGADRMTELARSIALASPQRRTLELLARDLRTAGLRSGSDFWTGLHEILARSGSTSSPAPPAGGISFEKLERLYRETGAVLETTWIDVRAVLRSELLEDALERTRVLQRDQENLVDTWRSSASGAPPDDGTRLVERQQSLLRQATRVGARLTSLSQESGPGDVRLEALGRAYLQNTVVPLDGFRRALAGEPGNVEAAARATLTRLPWALQDIVEARRRLEGQVRATRERLESSDPVGRDLASLLELLERATEDVAPATVANEALGSILQTIDGAIVEVDEELDLVESMAYADLETVTDLTAILRILEESRRDVLLGGREDFFPEEDSELLAAQGGGPGPADSMAREQLAPVSDRIRRVLEAYRVTTPSRRLGLAIQSLDLVASSGEELVSRLRRAEPWKLREIRFHARAQAEILGSLQLATKLLTDLQEHGDSGATREEVLSRGLAAPITSLDRAAAHMSETLTQLDFSRTDPAAGARETTSSGGADRPAPASPDARLLSSREEARSGVIKVDEAIVQTEDLRKTVLSRVAGAAAARRWLREQRGALADRVRRLADREARLAGRVDAALREFKTSGARPSSQLLIEHEELRRSARELAEQARREGDAALGGDAGVDRSRRYDRAAARLATIADGPMLGASRALSRAEEAPDDQIATFCLEATTLENQAVEALRALAAALGTLESDEALEDLGAELDELLAGADDERSQQERTIEEILAEAQTLLEKSREATATLAARLADSPRYRPVLDALQTATEHLQTAVRAAQEGARDTAEKALARGREKLMEAATLAREIRGEQKELVDKAGESLASTPETEGPETLESEEMQALRKEVERMLAELQATQAAAREIDELFREIVGAPGDDADPNAADSPEARDLEKLEERLLDEFNEKFMTLDQLVGLIAKILEIEKDAGTLKVLEDELARTVLAAAGAPGRQLEKTAGEQTRLTKLGEELADRFMKAGFRLTASLPQVMTAYWKGGDAAARITETQTTARIELDKATVRGTMTEAEARGAYGMLADAGKAIDAFLARLRETRQAALQAITEQESGIDDSSLGQRQIEASRSSLSQALEMMRQGQLKEAQAAHRQSMRSLAQATRAIRKGSSVDLLPEAAAGGRGIDAGGDFVWKVLTRGDESVEELRFARGDVVELPYPTRFRELVRIYLKALAERSR